MASELSATRTAFALPHGFCIAIEGADAGRVINNLCTNDVARLSSGECCEAFVTNLRGWVVAHAMIGKLEHRTLLLGQHPEPQSICDHIERYIIREDAQVMNLSSVTSVFVLVQSALQDQAIVPGGLQVDESLVVEHAQGKLQWSSMPAIGLGQTAFSRHFAWCERSAESGLLDLLADSKFELGAASDFELMRILNFWPQQGREILEKSLPQELDRDSIAISFTKGCYLGQETIARLDARGQLQKKLCLLEIEADSEPRIACSLFDGVRDVGILSSVAPHSPQKFYGLATLKRGAFEVGKVLQCEDSSARVLQPGSAG